MKEHRQALISHIRVQVFRGLLAIIPLAVTALAVGFLYVVINQKVMGLVDQIIGFSVPGMGILLVLVTLYLPGSLASHVLGRRVFLLIDRLTQRIPLINTTYQIGQQLSSTLSLPEQRIFKRVVLVEYFKPGMWTIGTVISGGLIGPAAIR
jgi:uncharacterized membrane protein